MTESSFHTVLGSLDGYRKGEIEITTGDRPPLCVLQRLRSRFPSRAL